MTQTDKTTEVVGLTSREKLVRIMKKEQALMIQQVLSQPPEYSNDKKRLSILSDRKS